MRRLGTLECADCKERHEIHVNRAGQLVALQTCAASQRGALGAVARRQLQTHLVHARDELNLATQMFTARNLDVADLFAQLDEVLRCVVSAQNTIGDHADR